MTKRFIVVDENLRPVSGIRGQSKGVATKIKREWTKCSKDKKHRLYKFCKRRKYSIMELKK